MKLSEKPHIKAKIEAFRKFHEEMNKKGLQVLPSINGPYLLDPKTGLTFRIETNKSKTKTL